VYQARVCGVLLEAGADINGCNRQGVTALHSAALNGSAAVVEALLARGAGRNTREREQREGKKVRERDRESVCVTVLQSDVRLESLRLSSRCLRVG